MCFARHIFGGVRSQTYKAVVVLDQIMVL